jgi:IgA peptidase M64
MFIRTATVASLLLSSGLVLAGPGNPAQPGQWVHGCWGDETGALSGVRIWIPGEPVLRPEINIGRGVNGDNRLDMVFVGDGYTADELGQYASDVDNVIAGFFVFEPFITYESYFRITRVDVISNESGVDNDPSQGINRDTALDMEFWCFNIERLLCVNVGKAYNAANAGASDVDQLLAVANSSKYGGAGYPGNDLGTLSGQNSSSVQVAIHEMGHSLGNLADEYTYGGPSNWTDGEPPEVNNSIFTASQMNAMETKWWQWAGYSDNRFDSPVGNYEGAHYSQTGIYRPSNNSMMRALSRKFNAPSAEMIITQIYQYASPVDGFSPGNAAPLTGTETLTVSPMEPIGHSLVVSWTLDGSPVGGDQTNLDLSALELAGTHTVTATVVDPTDMVVDETIRDTLLTETVSWTVDAAVCNSAADLNSDGVLDFFDVTAFLNLFSAGDIAADFAADGVLDFFDVQAFLSLFAAGCP